MNTKIDSIDGDSGIISQISVMLKSRRSHFCFEATSHSRCPERRRRGRRRPLGRLGHGEDFATVAATDGRGSRFVGPDSPSPAFGLALHVVAAPGSKPVHEQRIVSDCVLVQWTERVDECRERDSVVGEFEAPVAVGDRRWSLRGRK